MYTLHQLQCFVAVAEELSFRRAAERLVMTPPPLSRQISRLERAVGLTLLERSTRSVALTPAGVDFLDRAREILQLCREAPAASWHAATGTHGRISVGFTVVAALGVLGTWLRAMRQRHPHLTVALTESGSDRQVDMLLSGQIDLAFQRGHRHHPLLRSQLVQCEDLVVAVAADHELARRPRPLTVAEVARYPLVGYAPDSSRYFHELTTALMHQAGVTPHHAQYVTEISSILLLVETGLGAALVPASARGLRRGEGIVYLPLDDVPDDIVHLHAVWRTDASSPTLALGRALLPDLDQGR